MAVTVVVPGPLRDVADGLRELTIDGDPATVGAVLARLRRTHAALYERIMTERGEVRPHVSLFVGKSEIGRLGGLDTSVEDGSEIVILPAVSGG